MALIVEEGSGDADADAYVSVADVDDYHAKRGSALWTDVEAGTKDQCIRRATSYIDARFGTRFTGYRRTSTQALQWPRYDAFSPDGWPLADVPRELIRATCEYALRAFIYGVLAPDSPRMTGQNFNGDDDGSPSDPAIAGAVKKVRDKVGPIEKETEYETSSQALKNTGSFGRDAMSSLVSSTSIPEYPEADLLIEPLLANQGGTLTMERV